MFFSVCWRMQQLPELAVQWPEWRRYGGILSQMEVGDPWATAGEHQLGETCHYFILLLQHLQLRLRLKIFSHGLK